MTSSENTSVLVVGGGLVGLSTALLLQYHGIDFVLAERRAHASVLPRSRGVHTRTVEIFRQLGIEERVQQVTASALARGHFGGARLGKTLLASESLDMGAVRGGPGGRGAADSPSGFCFCPQVLLEPALAEVARERGGGLRFGTELTTWTQDADGVSATLTDRATGQVSTLRAEYLIAADGAASPIREAAGITGWTLPPTHYYLNVFVRADLTGLIGDRTFSQCEITNDAVRGVILSKNNTDEWSFHLEYDPERESIDDYSDAGLIDLVHAAIGTDEIPVEILARSVWDTGVHVADDYRRGRVLLAGDAAHSHAPWGGFGANAGIADAHNLIWKLSSVLSGAAAPALLDTYQPERRPCAVTAAVQARLRTEFHSRYGLATSDNAETLAQQIDSGAIIHRYRYASAAVISEHTGATVDRFAGQAGTRVPHVWLESEGRQISTLDLCGPGFTILTDQDPADWRAAAESAHAATGLAITVHHLGKNAELTDPHAEWRDRNELPGGGALLVRPDEHVAARSDEGLTPRNLTTLLERITGTAAAMGTSV
ncbi:FAD-dependent monooxygenase [Nocardia sp. NBC_01327]|uniref:FAD-dependent monooxygenase n=1 Tax=Nocardia sp. NBC_01327 TaxID=2903593 RepID=UPI002E0E3C50|nr:FAD-dependent monooxygenase [Nocardia sp. NBC_01327]